MIYWYDLTKGRCSGLFCVCASKSFHVCKQKVTKGLRKWECGLYSVSIYPDLFSTNAIDRPLCLYWLVTVLTDTIDNLLGFLIGDFNGMTNGVEIDEWSEASVYLYQPLRMLNDIVYEFRTVYYFAILNYFERKNVLYHLSEHTSVIFWPVVADSW